MTIATGTKNTMLDNWGVTQLSLHTAYSSSGSNELTGGSPAYARKNVTFSAASSGSKSASTQPVFDVPATTVRWVGKWAGATFAGMTPNGGQEREFWVDPSTDVFTSYAHGFANGDKVVFFVGTVPAPLSEGTVYFVRDATTDSFRVETAPAAGAINITAIPTQDCVTSKIVEEVYAGQGTHTITQFVSNANG